MICGGENGTNGCPVAGFSEEVAFAHHFMAINLTPTLPPYRSANGIGYVNKNSKVVGNSASYSPNSWWIDRL